MVSGIEILKWLLHSFSSCKFNTHLLVFRKSIPSRHSIPTSAVITNYCSTSGSLGCNCTKSVILPIILTAELLAVNTRFEYVCTIPGFPSFSYVDQLKSDILLPLSINPTHLFPWSMISAFRYLIVFVEQTLMTLQFSVVFFLKGQFLFKCWELPHRKQFRQFLERCPSCPQALHLKPCLSVLLDGSSLSKDLSRWLGPGVGNRRQWLNPRSCCCHLSRLSSPHRPREPLRSLDWFQRFSRSLSSTDNWFSSLLTASTKSFVSSRLITATLVFAFPPPSLLQLPDAMLFPKLFQFSYLCRRFAFWDLTSPDYGWFHIEILSERDGL